MRRAACLLGMFALLAIAAPAAAQRTGTRIGEDLNIKNAGKALVLITACYANGRARQAHEWLTSWPGSENESVLLKREEPQFDRCTDNDAVVMDGRYMKFQSNSMRRPLGAEMARRRLLTLKSVSPPAADAPFAFSKDRLKTATMKFDAAQHVYLEFGHCVALRAWDASLDLLRSTPGSPAERSAINKIIPELGPCLVEGMQVKLQRDTIRDVIGEPVYHLLADTSDRSNSDA